MAQVTVPVATTTEQVAPGFVVVGVPMISNRAGIDHVDQPERCPPGSRRRCAR
jgi:hypothetical protein